MDLSILLSRIVLLAITIQVVCVLGKFMGRGLFVSSCPLPPGPIRLPIIGNAFYYFRLLRHDMHRGLTRLAETYGPVASFRPGMACNFIVVSSSTVAREALAEKDIALAAWWVPDNGCALSHSGASLLMLPSSNPLWKQHRTTVATHFSSCQSLNATRPIRERQTRKFTQHLRASSGQPISVGVAVLGVVLNSVSNVLFSEDVVDMSMQGPQLFKDLMVALTSELSKPNISDAYPFLAPLDLLGSRRTVAKTLAKFYKFLDEKFIEPRLGSNGTHGDLLDVILMQHAKSQITRSEITKFFTDIFVGASDTSTIAVQWAMAELLHNQEKMKKVRAELVDILGDKEFVEESDLGKLPYLHAVVKETLRLHPTVPLVVRKVVTDGLSIGGFMAPAGSCVLVNLWAIGRDPATWKEPEQFVPERFLSSPELNFRGPDFSYKPFGAGRRVCPGMDMASRFVPLVLASMLHNIDWSLPNGMEPEDVNLGDHFGTVLELATPLCAVPTNTM